MGTSSDNVFEFDKNVTFEVTSQNCMKYKSINFFSVTEDKMEFMTMFENIPAATNRMKPALTILRIMGYFCGFHRDERRKTFKRKIVTIFLTEKIFNMIFRFKYF